MAGMAWNELEHRRQHLRRAEELLQEARKAKEMIASGDLAGAAERLAESVIELASMLKEELERPDRR
jgi:hypothetical protein